MYVKEYMRTEVYTIRADATLGHAMRIMAKYLIGMLPVVDDEGHLVGILSIEDVLKQFMPHFVEMLQKTDFVQDYGSWERGLKTPEVMVIRIRDVMQESFYVKEDAQFMAPMVVMYKHRSTDVPVVNDEKKVVGLVSHARVGGMFLKEWLRQFDTNNTDVTEE
jgi:CBS domain-containing protein